MPIFEYTLTTDTGSRTLKLVLDPEDPGQRGILAALKSGAPYEPDVSLFLARALRPGDGFVDVGANVGYYTVLGAGLIGPEGRVAAFEPSPENAETLASAIRENGFQNVAQVTAALSDTAGEGTLWINSDDRGGNALWNPAHFPGNEKSKATERKLSVETNTLDGALTALGFDTPRAVKIDTEGAEAKILAGAGRLIGTVPYFVVELHGFGLEQMGSSQMALRAPMEAAGYGTFVLRYDGAIPAYVPPGSRIESRYILNFLFAKPADVAALWPAVGFDPATLGAPNFKGG
jgi:FkbM family methyltransferase